MAEAMPKGMTMERQVMSADLMPADTALSSEGLTGQL